MKKIKKNEMSRQQLKDLFWSWIEPSLEGYSKQLEELLDSITYGQLLSFVEERVDFGDSDDDEEDEDAETEATDEETED